MAELPVAQCLTELRTALATYPVTILTAETGSGKTTWLPLQLLDQDFLTGKKIVMLEPRRVAARAAANRLAYHTQEPVGKTVGYSVRFDSKTSNTTRLEVVTEGILARRIVNDPELKGVGLIIFDEFHERHVETDLALALALESQSVFRPDLKILIMSATIDTARLSQFFAGAPIISAKGTNFPVEMRYHNDQLPTKPREIAEFCARKAIEAHAKHEGDVLIFLPGFAELQAATQLIEARKLSHTKILQLYGEQSPAEQDEVLRKPKDGERRIIAATPIAESSLTVERLTVVIDSGLAREPRHDAATGISHLETVNITQDSAVQRAGRAGRLGPGICYRMYHEAEFKRRPKTRVPEILRTDLADACLRTLAFGQPLRSLKLIDRPAEAMLTQAEKLLHLLGATDAPGKLTSLGQKAAVIPLGARLAVMLSAVPTERTAHLAAELSEREPAAIERTFQHLKKFATGTTAGLPAALLYAYPDRIAIRKSPGAFLTRTGRGLTVAESDELFDAEFIVAADLSGGEQNAKLRHGYAISREEVLARFSGDMVTKQVVREIAGKPRAFEQMLLDAIVMAEREISLPDGYARALELQKLKDAELSIFLSDTGRNLCARVELARGWGLDLPDFSEGHLLNTLEDWLLPGAIDATNLHTSLVARLSYAHQKILSEQVPERLTMPSGASHQVNYGETKSIVSVRIQEVFGMTDHPVIGEGKLKVTLELLSPRQQPIAVTNDLPAFWKSTYAEVRKEMRGRYPKHFWPEDPLSMQGTTGTKKAFDRKKSKT